MATGWFAFVSYRPVAPAPTSLAAEGDLLALAMTQLVRPRVLFWTPLGVFI